jgi:DNA methylase
MGSELLIAENVDIGGTGFPPVEIDQLAIDFDDDRSDPAEDVNPEWLASQPVTTSGDLWQLGNHRLLCGDARDADTIHRLMDGDRAAMAFLDPPYNVRVRDIVGRGERKHQEFAMASGELSRERFVDFLIKSLDAAAAVSRNGALHYVCMDWRHIGELIEAARAIYHEMINLAVWVKTNGGMGSLYRSQHELIGIFRVGDAPHVNNVELGVMAAHVRMFGTSPVLIRSAPVGLTISRLIRRSSQ